MILIYKGTIWPQTDLPIPAYFWTMASPNPDTHARYFIALVPPEPVYSAALEWKKWFRDHYHTKKALNSPPHITLQMPFRWREDREEEIANSLVKFAKSQAALPMTLNGFAAFPPRVIYLNVPPTAELLQLQKALSKMLRREHGIHHDTHRDHGFVPHLTVAFRDLKKAAFEAAWAEVQAKEVVHEYVQPHLSLLKHNGSVWEEHRRFGLGEGMI